MLIIDVKNNESIDQALRRYKRKYRQTKVRQELMERKAFIKPSVKRRLEVNDAIYREQLPEQTY